MNPLTKTIVVSHDTGNNYLTQLIEKLFPKIRVTSIVDNYQKVITFINEFSPKVIFLDTSLDELEEENIVALCNEKMIKHVFVYKKMPLIQKVFKPNINNYFFTTFKEENLLEYQEEINDLSFEASSDESMLDHIGVSSIEKIDVIRKSDIFFIASEGRYSTFYIDGREKIMSSKNIGCYQKILENDKRFVRIHHKYLINIDHISVIHKKDGSYCEMNNKRILPISRRKQQCFFNLLLHK